MKTRWLFPLAACLVGLALGADWPQFRGPNRDGISSETGLLKTWPMGGPPLVWTYRSAGVGFSGPAIVGDRLYMAGGRDGDEYVYALDLKANPPTEKWSVKIGPIFTWKNNIWNEGPIATPTVDGDLLYALGGQGILICVKTADGKEVWRKDLPKELAAEVDPVGGGPGTKPGEPVVGWGFAWAPLVDGEKLICVPGGKQGTVAALDKKTGNVLWRSKELTDRATYAAPIAVEAGGVRQYVVLTNRGAFGVAATNGDLLWSHLRPAPLTDIVASTPLFHDGLLYVTAGAGGGCDLLKLTANGPKVAATPVYNNTDMSNLHGGVVLAGDFVYGHSVRLLPFSGDLKARKSCENGQPRFLETPAPHRGVSKTQGLEPRAEVSALLNRGFPEV